MKPSDPPFNTAVFYDIENLLKGYNFSQQLAADLSLKEILGDIVETNLTGRIAVQRAYANWSDPRLRILRNEINELGIDPVQVFGFSKDARKNAADIQLAIDAVDLAHMRPAIDTFVIVSGDGGFSALAKKLHEYGRSVIGSAYRNTANQTFQAVCDAFVWIDPPDEEDDAPQRVERPVERQVRPPQASPPATGESISGSALLDEVVAKMRRLGAACEREQIEKGIGELLKTVAEAPSFRRQLEKDGVPLAVYGQALREWIPAFDPPQLGFPKLTDLLRRYCTGTPWQVGRRLSDGIMSVFPRNALAGMAGFQALNDIHEDEIHGESFYRGILRHGEPILRIESAAEFCSVVEHVCAHPPVAMGLGEAIEDCAEALQGGVPTATVKQSVLALVAGGVFNRTPQGVPLAEQKLTFREEFAQPQVIVDHIRILARSKITKLLGRVDDGVLSAIL